MKRDAPEAVAQVPRGLVYVSDAAPGIRRLRKGDGFVYRRPDGKPVRAEAELQRIRKLAIPPAYEDVWICTDPRGHLQATGRDARGRKQYRYHPDWRLARDADKFERMLDFGAALPKIRRRVAADLAAPVGAQPGRDAVLATLVRLLDTTLVRVGNDEYARSNHSYGLTTLRNRHAAVSGSRLKLRFRGKSGVVHEVALEDPRVARVVRRCQAMPGQELFQYEDEAGATRSVGSADVNDYIRESAGASLQREGLPDLARQRACVDAVGRAIDGRCRASPEREPGAGRSGAPPRQHRGGLQEGLRPSARAGGAGGRGDRQGLGRRCQGAGAPGRVDGLGAPVRRIPVRSVLRLSRSAVGASERLGIRENTCLGGLAGVRLRSKLFLPIGRI